MTTTAQPSPALSGPPGLFDLTGSVAIVTGASSGLGDRFARVLCAAGATVVAGARRVDRLELLAAEVGPRLIPLRCDVTEANDRDALVEAALAVDGRIDVLVNNAGYGGVMPAEDESLEHFEHTMAVNVTATFALCQSVGRHMLGRRSGSIVNIASIMGIVASTPVKQAGYCASKGAVVNLTRELGVQWARKGVRVNAIAPGWFPSELTQETMFDDEDGDRFVRANCPMGRGGEVDELDGALLYLAGRASTYVTGQILAVDGGWVAR